MSVWWLGWCDLQPTSRHVFTWGGYVLVALVSCDLKCACLLVGSVWLRICVRSAWVRSQVINYAEKLVLRSVRTDAVRTRTHAPRILWTASCHTTAAQPHGCYGRCFCIRPRASPWLCCAWPAPSTSCHSTGAITPWARPAPQGL